MNKGAVSTIVIILVIGATILVMVSQYADLSIASMGKSGRCTQMNPRVWATTPLQIGEPNTVLDYSINIENQNYGSGCQPITYNLSISGIPAGWSASLNKNVITIPPATILNDAFTLSIHSSGNAVDGVYSLSAAASYAEKRKVYSSSAGVQYLICGKDPTVSISPWSTQNGTAGSIVYYTIFIKNNNPDSCPGIGYPGSSTFDLSYNIPNGWSITTGLNYTVILTGGNTSLPFALKSSANATSGDYTFTVTATERNAPVHSGSGSGAYHVN